MRTMAITEIKNNLKTEKLVLGCAKTLKLLKLGKLSKVFVSANTPKDMEEDIKYYTKLADVDVEKVNLPNDELGTYCKKPYSISVIGLKS